MSETTRLDWDRVQDMNIYECFNYYSYAIEKNKRENEALEKWKRTH